MNPTLKTGRDWMRLEGRWEPLKSKDLEGRWEPLKSTT